MSDCLAEFVSKFSFVFINGGNSKYTAEVVPVLN